PDLVVHVTPSHTSTMYYAEIGAGDYDGATNVLINLSYTYGTERPTEEEIRTLPLLLLTMLQTLDITRLAIVGEGVYSSIGLGS
ncbi:hypothetical protein KIPB_013661, partial [Kipferlia bialata]